MKIRSLPIKNIWPSLVGNVLEFYDLGLYGFYSALLYLKYFPESNSLTRILASSGIFAAGFIMRPLGALIFGYIGDIYGRKRVLILTLALTALCSVLIGVMPTYEVMGIYASLFLTILRLMQGICTGGEYNTAAIFILEHMPKERHGFLSGVITATAILGFFLASGMAYLTSLEFMPKWAWRLPFILGGGVALMGYKIRRLSYETEAFLNLGNQNQRRFPLVEAFQENKTSLISTIGVGWLAGVLSLSIVGFIHTYLIDVVKVTSSSSYSISHLGLFIYMVSLPLYGYISDYIGYKQLMERSAFISLLASLPLFILFSSGHLPEMIIAAVLLAFLAGAFLAPMHAYMFSIFPADQRCSSISFCFSIGVAIFGGTAPIISTLLIEWSGLIYAPAFYFLLSAFIGLFSLIMQSQEKFFSLSHFQKLSKIIRAKAYEP